MRIDVTSKVREEGRRVAYGYFFDSYALKCSLDLYNANVAIF